MCFIYQHDIFINYKEIIFFIYQEEQKNFNKKKVLEKYFIITILKFFVKYPINYVLKFTKHYNILKKIKQTYSYLTFNCDHTPDKKSLFSLFKF